METDRKNFIKKNAMQCTILAGFLGLPIVLCSLTAAAPWSAGSEGPARCDRLALVLIRGGVCACSLSHIRLFATPWAVACQASNRLLILITSSSGDTEEMPGCI